MHSLAHYLLLPQRHLLGTGIECVPVFPCLYDIMHRSYSAIRPLYRQILKCIMLLRTGLTFLSAHEPKTSSSGNTSGLRTLLGSMSFGSQAFPSSSASLQGMEKLLLKLFPRSWHSAIACWQEHLIHRGYTGGKYGCTDYLGLGFVSFGYHHQHCFSVHPLTQTLKVSRRTWIN